MPVLKNVVRLLAIAGLALAGCNGNSQRDEIVRTGQLEPKVRADGTLTADPPPLTIKDIEQEKEGSPEETVLRLWFWGQWGSSVNMASLHSEPVRRALGPVEIMDAYAALRAEMLASLPRVVESGATPYGRLVTIEARRQNARPIRESVVLQRQDDGWTIVQDTILERGLAAVAHGRVEPDSNGKPDARAIRAGERVVRAYRQAVAESSP